jgi:hypothetical protein
MIISDPFVFAHIPKTGGVFLQDLIKSFFPAVQSWEGGESHHSVEFLPPDHVGKPIFALLRNPWSWYVSWFAFCKANRDNEEFRRNYSPGETEFEDTIRNLLRPGHCDPVINEFMARENIGLLEMHRFHIMDLEVESHDITYGRMECLAADFSAFLEDWGIDIPNGIQSALQGPPQNRSEHGPWREYYSGKLRDLVGEKERMVIGLGGYSF